MYRGFKKEEAEQKPATPHKTVDTNELYEQIALQTGESKNQFYEKHTRGWEREVEKATEKLEDQMEELEDQEEENAHRKKTVDLGDLYNNINLQTRTRHSDAFEARVQAYEEAMEKDQKEDEAIAAKLEQEEKAKKIMAQGMTPAVMPEIHHPNPSINMAEMYGGIDEPSFVQMKFEHEHDVDDVVPEFTENVVIEPKKAPTDPRKTDFNGEKYTEVYDD